MGPEYLGVAAQCSFSARLRHCLTLGFSISFTSCGLRRMITLSPGCKRSASCPSQKSVVPGFTRTATITTGEALETTTGRNDKECGQIGVTQNASTSGETIGPPAETLYAVEPEGVATIIPSPKYRIPVSESA